jgi:Tfp pilus assembly protein PilX
MVGLGTWRALNSMRLSQRLRRQDGIALIMSLGVLVVLTIAGTTALY